VVPSRSSPLHQERDGEQGSQENPERPPGQRIMLRRRPRPMKDFEEVIIYALVLYSATLILTSSRSMQMVRNTFRKGAFKIWKGTKLHNSFVHVVHNKPVLENDVRDEEDVKEIGVGYDFISCRMCVGFWLSLPLLLVLHPLYWGAAYGLAYFLSTQERE
jgi:hypothetical protein